LDADRSVYMHGLWLALINCPHRWATPRDCWLIHVVVSISRNRIESCLFLGDHSRNSIIRERTPRPIRGKKTSRSVFSQFLFGAASFAFLAYFFEAPGPQNALYRTSMI